MYKSQFSVQCLSNFKSFCMNFFEFNIKVDLNFEQSKRSVYAAKFKKRTLQRVKGLILKIWISIEVFLSVTYTL